MLATLKDTAIFFRAALVLGLISGERVIRWADQAIECTDSPSPELLELSLAARSGDSGIIEALGAVAGVPIDQPYPDRVVRALIDVLRDDLLTGRRDLPEVVGSSASSATPSMWRTRCGIRWLRSKTTTS